MPKSRECPALSQFGSDLKQARKALNMTRREHCIFRFFFCFRLILEGHLGGHLAVSHGINALNSTVRRYGNVKGCIAPSDRGSQFTSHLYWATLEARGFRQSMGRIGTCADNARMESFFATLKKELIYRLPLYRLTRNEVRGYVFEWIAYYNHKRRHTANEGALPPLIKRELYARCSQAA